MPHFGRWLLTAFASLTLAVACEQATPVIEPAEHPDHVGEPIPLDEACERLAATVCEAREPCCRAFDLAYDPPRCTAREQQRCEQTVASVHAGLTLYDGSQLDACLQELRRLNERCVLPLVDGFFESFDLTRICGRAFMGTVAVGELCDRDVQCAQADATVASCDDTTGRCTVTRVREEGDSCNTQGDFCRPELFCDFDLSQMPYEGTCERASSLGASCEPAAPVDRCGPHRFCDPATRACVPNLEPGEPCTSDNVCQSGLCADESCSALSAVIGPGDCTGD